MPSNIAALVNLHKEGASALPSIISAWRAVEHARSRGLSCTAALVLDRANPRTLSIAEGWRKRGFRVIISEHGDLGMSRNLAAESVDAEWIAFLDGDDLWGEHWLTKAYQAAEHAGETDQLTVWHPALNIIFGDHHSVVHHLDSTHPSFSWSRFRLHNQWTALCFVRRSDLLNLQYPRNDIQHGFGFEDWSWNTEVLRVGGRHRVVPETCHFIHRSLGPSLLSTSQQALRTPYLSEANSVHILRPPEQIPTRTHNASTHEIAPLVLDVATLIQIRLAATISPDIAETVDPKTPTTSLPQNFQTHVTDRQRALGAFESARRDAPSQSSIGELLHSCDHIAELEPTDRAAVVAEVLLDPELRDREWGSSTFIDETIAHYPQLKDWRDAGLTNT